MRLKANPNPDETDPRIPAVTMGYTFRLAGAGRRLFIIIHNGTIEKPYSVDNLKQIAASNDLVYAEPVRDMARQALETFGLLPEEDELSTDTITTIAGIKVYQEISRFRRFFAKVGGRVVRSKSIGEIEKAITGES